MPHLPIRIAVQVLPHGEGLPLPRYATDGAAGCDLHAAVVDPLTLAAGERAAVATGLVLAIPEGFEGASCASTRPARSTRITEAR